MAEQDRGSDDPQLALIARHALHDEELIAAFAANDVEDAADGERARSLVDRCPTCHELHRDLSAIRAATRSSGAAAERATSLAAPRDFRLTAEDARRLRPASPVARLGVRMGWRARLAHGVGSFGRPLGAAMATFGIAGLLVGTLTLGGTPLAEMSGGASAGAPAGVDTAGTEPAASIYRASYGPLATVKGRGSGAGEPGGGVAGGETGEARETSDGVAWRPVLLGGSIVLVVLGIALVVAAQRNLRPISTQRGN